MSNFFFLNRKILEFDKMSSKCKHCGEKFVETGNFTLRILPAKRIPKKARKLFMEESSKLNVTSSSDSSLASSWAASSFQKFLLKRSNPTNLIEMTCGNCGTVSRTKMQKPHRAKYEHVHDIGKKECQFREKSTSVNNQAAALTSTKLKKVRNSSAGLTLLSQTITCNTFSNRTTVDPNSKGSNTKKSAIQQKKEMENLKKILFESKKAKKSGSSLKDFLSGI